jgi:hypothetical protein
MLAAKRSVELCGVRDGEGMFVASKRELAVNV